MSIAFYILMLATGVAIVITGFLTYFQEHLKHAYGWICVSQVVGLLFLTAAMHIAMAEGWF